MTLEEQTAVCHLARSVALLVGELQTRNSAEWMILQQVQRDLAVVEKQMGGYCANVPERAGPLGGDDR